MNDRDKRSLVPVVADGEEAGADEE